MDQNKIIVISPNEFYEFLQPILQKLEILEALILKKNGGSKVVFSETEASDFLTCSKKKLQHLRNTRQIGFIRENGGRKILYKYDHLMEYLQKNELKKIK